MSNVNKIEIFECDQTFVQIVADRGIIKELGEYFTYEVQNARFMPAYQNKLWDGRVRLLDFNTQRIYRGLIPYIVQFAKDRNFEVELEPSLIPQVTNFDVQAFVDTLDLTLTPFDFQLASVKHSIENNRCTMISPTSSGKSLIIYILIRYYLEVCQGNKILICVPTVGLVNQLISDFKEYCPNFPIEKFIHKIYSGEEKTSNKPITISTWQSIYKQKRTYFADYKCIIIDEAHHAQAESLKGILEKAVDTPYRFGLTGTLDDLEYNRLVIEGLCGPTFQVTKTKDLMKRGIVSELEVRCMILKYDDDTRKFCKAMTYQEEMKFVIEHNRRTRFIDKLVKSIPNKNILILTGYLKHIDKLKEQIEKSGKIVYVATGKVPAEEREAIRQLTEKNNNVVIIATYGVFSTGISIKNLQYVIFASGSKSQIRVLQSIGRGLRLDGKANRVYVIDIVDEFGYKGKRNYLTKHFFERVKIYTKEEFVYKTFNINI